MNSVCDMTQFIVAHVREHITASYSPRLYMEDVLLIFWIYSVIVVDADSKFKNTFLAVVKYLIIYIHIAAVWNHKTIGVERIRRF